MWKRGRCAFPRSRVAQDAPAGVAAIRGKALGDGWQNRSRARTGVSVAVRGPQRTPVRVGDGPYHAPYRHHVPFDTTPYKTPSMPIQGSGGGGQALRIPAVVGGKPLDRAHPVTLPAAGGM